MTRHPVATTSPPTTIRVPPANPAATTKVLSLPAVPSITAAPPPAISSPPAIPRAYAILPKDCDCAANPDVVFVVG